MKISNKKNGRVVISLWILFAACLFHQCSGGKQNQQSEKLTFSQPSIIKCTDDTSHSYYLYLPSSYDAKKLWPVIFLYDPHGSGLLSIENFKEAAERYGYVLAGSNNSRNGVGGIDNIIGKLATDVLSKYPIDKHRIYAAGFSGGGRVALTQALMMSDVKGIFVAGAGAGSIDFSALNHKFDIYATAGLGDFNYMEVTSIQQQLQGLGWRYIIRNFEGGHAWPPKDVINEAVLWFTLNAMRDKVLSKDEALVKRTIEEKRLNIDTLVKSGRLVDAQQAADNATMLLKLLSSTKKFERTSEKVRKMPEYKAELELRTSSFNLENEMKQGLLNSFTSQDSTWWKNQVSEIDRRINTPGEMYSRQMFMRVKGFLGIVAYTFTNDVIMRNQMDHAERLISIYQIIEPANADAMFFKAIMFDRRNNPTEALAYMKKARELGFADWKKFNDVASPNLKREINL
jgi:predicted esterase